MTVRGGIDGGRLTAAVVLLVLGASANAGPEPIYSDIAPIFQQHCVPCHQGAAAPLGLRLDSLANLRKGGQRGEVVVAGSPAASELVRRLRGTSQPRMPMTGPPWLPEEHIVRIEAWIRAGLPAGDAEPTNALANAPANMTPRPAPDQLVTYQQVAPIFATRCAKCHADNGQMGGAPEGFRLTSYADTLSEGERVRVVPRNPGASLLVRHLRGLEQPRMPFDGPPYLGEAEIQLIERWIADGAADARGIPAPVPVGAEVRLEGELTAPDRVDDVALMIGPGTRIDKRPRVGDRVRVRGYIDARGQLVVERLRRR